MFCGWLCGAVVLVAKGRRVDAFSFRVAPVEKAPDVIALADLRYNEWIQGAYTLITAS